MDLDLKVLGTLKKVFFLGSDLKLSHWLKKVKVFFWSQIFNFYIDSRKLKYFSGVRFRTFTLIKESESIFWSQILNFHIEESESIFWRQILNFQAGRGRGLSGLVLYMEDDIITGSLHLCTDFNFFFKYHPHPPVTVVWVHLWIPVPQGNLLGLDGKYYDGRWYDGHWCRHRSKDNSLDGPPCSHQSIT